MSNNTSVLSAGGGLAVGSQGSIQLVNGSVVSHNSAVNSSGGGVVLFGNSGIRADDSVVFFNNSVGKGYVGGTIAAFDNSKLNLARGGRLTKCSVGVYLGWSTCQAGETQQHDMCVCCPQHTFSFTNASCEPCPIPSTKLPLAMQRQLVYFLSPVFVLLGVLAVQWLAWALVRWVVPLVWRLKEGATQQPASSVARKLPVTLLVVAFYAYPTLLRASLSFFACLRIDRVPPEVQLPPGATPLSTTQQATGSVTSTSRAFLATIPAGRPAGGGIAFAFCLVVGYHCSYHHGLGAVPVPG